MTELVDARRHPYLAYYIVVLVSVAGAIGYAAGLYQNWVKAPEDQRIAVALDVSRTYLRDVKREDIELYSAAVSGELDVSQQNKLALLADNLEYYSLLANNGRLDPAFLSRALICAITCTARAAEKYKFSIPTGGEPLELLKFAKTVKCAGPTYQ
jgi:hypothetical protein